MVGRPLRSVSIGFCKNTATKGVEGSPGLCLAAFRVKDLGRDPLPVLQVVGPDEVYEGLSWFDIYQELFLDTSTNGGLTLHRGIPDGPERPEERADRRYARGW